jgi:hypothetical protein
LAVAERVKPPPLIVSVEDELMSIAGRVFPDPRVTLLEKVKV